MAIQLGTKVKFLNDKGGGRIIGFRDDKYAVVETDDGFEVPVLISEIIIDEGNPYDGSKNSKSKNTVSAKTSDSSLTVKEISFEEKKYLSFKGEGFMAIVPENEQLLHVSNFSLYLINTSNYYLSYVIYKELSGTVNMVKMGVVKPGKISVIAAFSQTEITKITALQLQGTYFKYGLSDVVPQFISKHNLENISFYKIGHFHENEYFNSRALIMKEDKQAMQKAIDKLTQSEIAKISLQKDKKEPEKIKPKPANIEIEEVDLHIEAILENTSGMENGEIINVQLGRFETSLETALRSKLRKIVFIHGVGNGKLRQELRKTLDRKYPNLKYQDASFQEYGYGATMIYLK